MIILNFVELNNGVKIIQIGYEYLINGIISLG